MLHNSWLTYFCELLHSTIYNFTLRLSLVLCSWEDHPLFVHKLCCPPWRVDDWWSCNILFLELYFADNSNWTIYCPQIAYLCQPTTILLCFIYLLPMFNYKILKSTRIWFFCNTLPWKGKWNLLVLNLYENSDWNFLCCFRERNKCGSLSSWNCYLLDK